MRNRGLLISIILLLLCVPQLFAIDSQSAAVFSGQDMHLSGATVISYQVKVGRHILVFSEGFSMSIGANEFSSAGAVVWLNSREKQYRGRVQIDYEAQVYLEGDVTVKKGKTAKTTDLTETLCDEGQCLVAKFTVAGEVFVTSDKRESGDPRELPLYKKGLSAVEPVKTRDVIHPGAIVPSLEKKKAPSVEDVLAAPEKLTEESKKIVKAKKPSFQYPVNIAKAIEPVACLWNFVKPRNLNRHR